MGVLSPGARALQKPWLPGVPPFADYVLDPNSMFMSLDLHDA